MLSPHLERPLDAMYLIHKALRAEAGRVEEAVQQLEIGGSFKPFQRAFYRWVLALGYHVENEDTYMDPFIADAALAGTKQAEVQQLMEMLEQLQTYLHEEIGKTIVIARTQRNLRAKVVLLRIAQDDMLEEEETDLLPMLRQQLSDAQQLRLMQHLCNGEAATDQDDMFAWMAQALTATEQASLAALAGRLQEVSAEACV